MRAKVGGAQRASVLWCVIRLRKAAMDVGNAGWQDDIGYCFANPVRHNTGQHSRSLDCLEAPCNVRPASNAASALSGPTARSRRKAAYNRSSRAASRWHHQKHRPLARSASRSDSNRPSTRSELQDRLSQMSRPFRKLPSLCSALRNPLSGLSQDCHTIEKNDVGPMHRGCRPIYRRLSRCACLSS